MKNSFLNTEQEPVPLKFTVRFIFLLIALSILLFGFQANAQTTLLSTGFEAGNTACTFDFIRAGSASVAVGNSRSGTSAAFVDGQNGSANARGYEGSVITPRITFRTGYSYTVSIWAKNIGAAGTLEIAKSTSATHASMTAASAVTILNETAITVGTYTNFTANFTVSSNENTYIGFILNASANNIEVYLDDLTVTESAACPAIAAPSASNAKRCGLGVLAVSATPASGANSCRWYTTASGGSSFYTGSTYTKTFYSYQPVTYYVSSYNTTSGCESASRRTVTLTPAPLVTVSPTALSASVCSGNSTTIKANALQDTYYKNTTSVAIPDKDATGITSSVTVSGLTPTTLTNRSVAAVRFKINHTRLQDLEIYLISPAGTKYTLVNKRGGQNVNYPDIVLTDNAATSIINVTAPFTGFYIPETALSTISTGNINGTWQLNVVDNANNEDGTLVEWELVLRREKTGLTYNWSSTPSGFTSSTATASVTPSATTTYAVSVFDPANASCTASGTVSVTVETMITWLGVNTDWFNASNWWPCVPVSTSDILIPTGLARYPKLTTGSAMVNNLTIETGATVTVDGGSLEINGILTENGTLINTSGSLDLAGDDDYQIKCKSFNNLIIRGLGKKSLSGNTSIKSSLKMMQGKLHTGTDTLIFETDAILEETDDSYVQGYIKVVKDVNTASPYNFGGTGVIIEPNSGSTVFPGVTTITRTTGVAQDGAGKTGSILRAFQIDATNDTGLDVNLTIKYLASELNGLSAGELTMYRSTDKGATWSEAGVSEVISASNTVTLNNVTGFSKWTAGDPITPLPVELVSFKVRKAADNIILEWQTASELNNKGFEVQVSATGESFTKIAFVPSKSENSNQLQKYSFIHTSTELAKTNYYRLKQIDTDGTFSYSSIRAISTEKQVSVDVYPNPVKSNCFIQVNAEESQLVQVSLRNIQGKKLIEKNIQVLEGTQELPLDLSETLPNGTYLLTINANNTVKHVKLVVNK